MSADSSMVPRLTEVNDLSDSEIDRMIAGSIRIAVPNLDPSVSINRKDAASIQSFIQLYAVCYGFHTSHNSGRDQGSLTFYCVECAKRAKKHDCVEQTVQVTDKGEILAEADRLSVLCPKWTVKANRIKNGSYNITTRQLIHCHLLELPKLVDGGPRQVDSTSRITMTETVMLDKLLSSRRLNRSTALKETMEDLYTCEYDANVWKYFLSEARSRTKIPDGKEMSMLLSMMNERHLVDGDYFNFTIDADCVTDRIFIMSRQQIWNMQ